MTKLLIGVGIGLFIVFLKCAVEDLRHKRETGSFNSWGIPLASWIADVQVIVLLLILASIIWDHTQ